VRSGGKNKQAGADPAGQPDVSRLDKFLKNVGIVSRRALAQEACRRGLILVDGRPAKASTSVRAGNVVEVRLGMSLRRWRVKDIPSRPVARASRANYVELMAEEALEPYNGA
jgi:ribosomal 50S subunit-recycling heat shock protein